MKFKEVWPAAKRDCVSCSALINIGNASWAVCTQSVEHDSRPIGRDDKTVRMECSVNLVVRQRWKDPFMGTSRENSECFLFYTASVDPKGWIPHTIIRHFTVKKWPEALETLCVKALKNRPTGDDQIFVDCDDGID